MSEEVASDSATDLATCANCDHSVTHTDVGCTHIDRHGALAGWLCPPPLLTLAAPRPTRRTTPIPASPRHSKPAEPPASAYA